jgi:DNA-binding CsgD family transcriptional regulator
VDLPPLPVLSRMPSTEDGTWEGGSVTTSEPCAQSGHQRVIVTGQFRLMVETISRALPPTARAIPISLDTCTSTNAARDHVLRRRSTLVVLVLASLDTLYAPDLVSELVGRGRDVVVVGELADQQVVDELVAAGAHVAPEASTVTGLSCVVDRHLSGQALDLGQRPVVSTPLGRTGSGPTAEQRARSNLARLTPAEARTLWRLMHGSSVAEIARLHVVSVETVRSHIRGLLSKLGTTSQLAAVALAWEVDWHPAPVVLPAA